MKEFSKLIFVFVLVLGSLNTSLAQIPSKEEKAGKAAEIKSLIDHKSFVFKATPADTSKDSQSPHQQPYVAVSGDTLVVNLPVQAETDSVKFNGTGFGYQTAQNRNGNWNITIRPGNGMSDVRVLTLTVTPTGHASLRVIRSHGRLLSFEGYIKQEDY